MLGCEHLHASLNKMSPRCRNDSPAQMRIVANTGGLRVVSEIVPSPAPRLPTFCRRLVKPAGVLWFEESAHRVPSIQNAWAAAFDYRKRDAKASVVLFCTLRENNIAMLKTIPRERWDNYGMHSERGKETISHLTRMFAGHDTNHVLQVEGIVQLLKKKRK